jgi:hypothetical protein
MLFSESPAPLRRPLDWTVYRNGSLWTAQTIFLPASGTPNRCSVQWWQIDTTAGDLGGSSTGRTN